MRTEQINSVGCFSGPNGCLNLNTDSFPNDTYLSERNNGDVRYILFSVLIGRTITIESANIIETLDALRSQEGAPTYEVIIADRRLDNVCRPHRDLNPLSSSYFTGQ